MTHPRHCYAKPKFATVDHPGLIIDWRDTDAGREFLVTWWVEEDKRAITDWLTGDQVRPAKG